MSKESLAMGFSRRPVRFKQILVFSLLAFIIVLVWMSVKFPMPHKIVDKPMNHGQTVKKKPLQGKENLKTSRSNCGIDLPYLNMTKLKSLSCQLKLPLKDSCQFARAIASTDVEHCDTSNRVNYCSLSNTKKADCNINQCNGVVNLGYMMRLTGDMIWRKYQSSSQLGEAIELIINKGEHSYFTFISCSAGTQLLLLPDLPAANSHMTKKQTAQININTLFIDSASYYHFHRSLPKTVSKLKTFKDSPVIKVLTYPLFQSLKSRTYENMQALFSGFTDTEKTFSIQSMPYAPLNLQALLQPLRNKGYENLFMEDLCWTWEWGISKDLLVHNKTLSRRQYWTNLNKAFDTAGINSYGVSPAGCEILKANGKPDPFHGVPAVCYNGQYHHSYILDYLAQYQQARVNAGIPYTSFFSCNVPHEEFGTRIKTMDDDLVSHIDQVSKQKNTITVILSDHGNAYGKFPQSHQQGRDEMYQPILYMIVPVGVQQILGDRVMENLVTNQARLVTMVDIHHLFMHIAVPAKGVKQGLVSQLSPGRTCEDLPLYQPNICICDVEDDGMLSDTQLFLIAEYASAQLSKRLVETSGGVEKMKCNLLIPNGYSHAQSTASKKGGYTVSMDISYTSPTNLMESIFVTMSYKPAAHGTSIMKLLAFERRSVYSVYRHCGDGPATESLCICQSGEVNKLNVVDNWLTDTSRYSNIISSRESHQLNKCIHVIEYLVGTKGSSIYAINICSDLTFTLSIQNLDESRRFSYSPVPVNGWYLLPRSATFLSVLHSITSNLFPITKSLKFVFKEA